MRLLYPPRTHAREKRDHGDTALRLARYFNTTAQFWLNLQSSFDLKQAESEAGRKIAAEVRPMERAA